MANLSNRHHCRFNDLETNRAMARLFDSVAMVDDPEDRYHTGLMASWKVFDGFV